MKKTIGLVALVLATSTAHANVQQDFNEDLTPKYKGFYLGAGLGSTTFDSLDSLDFKDDDVKEDGNTIKFIAGYQFGKVFALEGQYTKYGDVYFPEINENYYWTPTAISLTANLGYTFDNGLRPFGLIGISAIDLGQSLQMNLDDKGVGLRYGLGLEYAPPALKGLSARVGYEVDMFSIEYKHSGVTQDYTLGSFYASVAYKF